MNATLDISKDEIAYLAAVAAMVAAALAVLALA